MLPVDWADSADHRVWRCLGCASAIELAGENLEMNIEALNGDGVWRYRDWIGIGPSVTLGEACTPLVTLPVTGRVQAKNDSLLPTGSFKDRGAAVFVAWLAERGAKKIAFGLVKEQRRGPRGKGWTQKKDAPTSRPAC